MKIEIERGACDCGGVTLVCKENKKIVGKLCVRKISWYLVEIKHTFVSEKHRRKGIAKRLNLEAFNMARDWECEIATATVREDNLPSIALMNSVGFIKCGEFTSHISNNKVGMYVKNIERLSNE